MTKLWRSNIEGEVNEPNNAETPAVDEKQPENNPPLGGRWKSFVFEKNLPS